jgi:hypothetical protein
MNNFFNNEHVQKKMKYYNDVYTAVKHVFVNNYESDSNGCIIIDEFKKDSIKEDIREDIVKQDIVSEDKESIEKNNKKERIVFIKKNIKEERVRKIKKSDRI